MLRLDGFKQLIHTPTRVTPTSKSSLDHIICNYDNKISQYGVITSGVSDHFLLTVPGSQERSFIISINVSM